MHEITDDPTSKTYADADARAGDLRSRRGRARACLLGLSGPLCGELIPLRPPALLLGCAEGAELRLVSEGVSRRHARLLWQRGAWWIEDLGSRNGTRVNRRRVSRALLHDGDQLQLAGELLCFLRADPLDERFHRQIYAAALRDGLTRVFNKRYFAERLRGEVAYAARHLQPLSLLLLDVDLFKRVNDKHGHPTGDRALRAIASALQRATRSEDVLARCGGEEFAVLCRGLRLDEARLLAERVRLTVAAARLALPEGPPLELTVSIGVAELPLGGPEAADAERLVSLADQALYEAKAGGRNCVRVAVGKPS